MTALETENAALRTTITTLETRVAALETPSCIPSPEQCDGTDNDCDGSTDEGELCGAGETCMGAEGCLCPDSDGDGVTTCAGDCDDADDSAYPGSTETCDGTDNDCDGYVDEGDLCGIGQTCLGTGGCSGPVCTDEDADGFTTCDDDCDDADPSIHPGGTEICNNIDEDCDGVVDNGAFCLGGTCVSGVCDAACTSPETECNGGCVNTGTDLQNCGSCGALCSIANGNPLCSGGACSVGSCNSGFLNCDGGATNGCEINANTDMANCGACGRACPATIPNGVSACMVGTCAASCSAGFGNCDHDTANGCEISLTSNLANCGACGNTCSAPNAQPQCIGGACSIGSCNAGFANCNGVPTDGCETNVITNTAHCGSCGHACIVPNGVPQCVTGACSVASCSPGYANCDGAAANGCEINSNTDAANCGVCGHACSIPNGLPGYTAGVCTVASCNAGFANCDGSAGNGCEARLLDDESHCGACGFRCRAGRSARTAGASPPRTGFPFFFFVRATAGIDAGIPGTSPDKKG